MPCDAACVKIIINTGFMAVLAPRVGARYGREDVAGFAAARLHNAATTLVAMAEARGFNVSHADDFDGCAQAMAMVDWITDGGTYSSEDVARQMNEWTTELWQHITDLVAGKPLA